jgi:hypothetical protein
LAGAFRGPYATWLGHLDNGWCRLPELPTTSAEEEQKLAYLRGEGPQPLCPPGIDPLTWDSHLRVECCLMEQLRGALATDAYLPDMSAYERREADALVTIIGQYTWAPPWFKDPKAATA